MADTAFQLNVNEYFKYTKKLDRLKLHDLPLAVRGTLNDAAFDMKLIQVEREFNKRFTIRKQAFIRSHTMALKVKNTFKVNQMISQVGIIAGKSDSGDELIHQEFGGRLKRDEIPTKEARVSGSPRKVVSQTHYLTKVKKQKGKKVYQAKEFRKAAIKVGKGGFVQYGNMIYKIQAVKKRSRSGLFIKALPIYNVKEGRVVRIKRRPFMAPAANLTSMKIPRFYAKQAMRRIKKYYG
jgi:hypothetical protein